jgi:hypothetical protein
MAASRYGKWHISLTQALGGFLPLEVQGLDFPLGMTRLAPLYLPDHRVTTMNRFLVASLLLLTLGGTVACDRATTTAPPTPGEPAPPTVVTPDTTLTPTTPRQTDYTIIPGQRVGQVTSTTSRQQLAALYGEANLKDEAIPMGEGFTEPGTLVDLGPDQQFVVVWLDAERNRPLLAKDFGSAWKTPEGLGVGVPYSQVQAVLGNFQLYGFAWDYGGTLSLEGSNLDQYYGDLLLRLDPAEEAVAEHPEAFQAVMGDRLFPSDDPNFALLDITVDEMMVYLNDPVD